MGIVPDVHSLQLRRIASYDLAIASNHPASDSVTRENAAVVIIPVKQDRGMFTSVARLWL
jgi:hypothetical protein